MPNVPPLEDGWNPFTEDVLREATPVQAQDQAPSAASNPFPDSDSASGVESGPPDPGKWKPLESESENSTSPWAAQVDPKPLEGESLEGDPENERQLGADGVVPTVESSDIGPWQMGITLHSMWLEIGQSLVNMV